MAHAEKCPVCNGSGKVEEIIPYNYGSSSLSTPINIKTCHGCNGSGWITVPDENVSRAEKLVNNEMKD